MLWMASVAMAGGADRDSVEVDAVLDALHAAAAAADAPTYFGLFTDDAVFVGTDAAEVWDLAAFRAFAAPHFAEPPAWVYTPVDRDVVFGASGKVAWFHESLAHATYGAVRGSGVLVRQGRTYRVAQYVLSFPIPNDVARSVVALVTDPAAAFLPTPYLAEQIRDAYVPGLVVVMEERENGAALRHRAEVLAADETTVTLRQGIEGAGAPTDKAFTWVELRDHARFPVGTSMADTTVEVPWGTFAARRYDTPDGATFWFSPAHPGPPLRMAREVDGKVVFELVMVERDLAPGSTEGAAGR